MTYFGIQGHEPQWLNGHREITAAHEQRLQAPAGRRLRHGWPAWDRDVDEWFADCPVLMDIDGEQVATPSTWAGGTMPTPNWRPLKANSCRLSPPRTTQP
jgi:hypothetical protein